MRPCEVAKVGDVISFKIPRHERKEGVVQYYTDVSLEVKDDKGRMYTVVPAFSDIENKTSGRTFTPDGKSRCPDCNQEKTASDIYCQDCGRKHQLFLAHMRKIGAL